MNEVITEYNKGVILKAVANGHIVGSVRAYADGDTVYIGKLMVHPDHQEKGLGKKLLSAIENTLHRQRTRLRNMEAAGIRKSPSDRRGFHIIRRHLATEVLSALLPNCNTILILLLDNYDKND